MTCSVPSAKRSKTHLAVGLAFILAPLPVAALLLVLGLVGSLVWVYLSIFVSILWIPLLVIGIVLLARPSKAGWHFNSTARLARAPRRLVAASGMGPRSGVACPAE